MYRTSSVVIFMNGHFFRPTTSAKSISWVSTIILGEKNLAPSKVGQTENFQTCLMDYYQRRPIAKPGKGQSPMILHSNCTGATLMMQRGRQQKTEMCWYKRKFLIFFFFQSRRAFLDALLHCLIWRRTSGFRITSLPHFVTVVDRDG